MYHYYEMLRRGILDYYEIFKITDMCTLVVNILDMNHEHLPPHPTPIRMKYTSCQTLHRLKKKKKKH